MSCSISTGPARRFVVIATVAVLLCLAVPGTALAFTCKGKSGAAACGGPTHGTCVGPDVCLCLYGWSGDECQIPRFCGTTSCADCNSPHGLCTVLGYSGKCYCIEGYTGACCESLAPGLSAGSLTPSALDFGGVTVGATAKAETVTFYNPTTKPLTLATIAVGGVNSADFALDGTCTVGGNVAAGASCTITVTFTPGGPGPRNAVLHANPADTAVPTSMFDTRINVPVSTVVESNAVTLQTFMIDYLFWVGPGTNVTIENGEFLIYYGGVWTNVDISLLRSHTYSSTDLVKIRQTSSASYSTAVQTRIVVDVHNPMIVRTFDTVTVAATSLTGTGVMSAGSIVIDPETPSTLYSAIDGAGIYKRTASDGAWHEAAVQPTNTRVKAIVIVPGDSAKLYAATYGGGVFWSQNSGAIWTPCANTNLANLNVISLTIDAAGTLYAGTEGGVFTSTSGCATWSDINNGLPN